MTKNTPSGTKKHRESTKPESRGKLQLKNHAEKMVPLALYWLPMSA